MNGVLEALGMEEMLELARGVSYGLVQVFDDSGGSDSVLDVRLGLAVMVIFAVEGT
jgi:hypothetical protein